MIDLLGTEKQVNWAVTIRKKKLEQWNREAGGDPVALDYLQVIENEPRSSWWISYKDADLKTILRHNRGGYDKTKDDMKKFLGLKDETKKPQAAPPVKPGGGTAGATKGPTTGMTVGPTRNIETGEIVEGNPDIPF